MTVPSTTGKATAANRANGHNGVRRVSTETKSAFKTTELVVYVASVIAVLIAAAVTDKGDDGQGFGADRAWLYVTLLTIGYMISRGLAKSGSYEKERQNSDD